MNDTESGYLKKLKSLVYDEDKIVTCLQIAKDLKISLQDSKALLEELVTDSDKLQDVSSKLSITYILNGIMKDGTPCVCLVKDGELANRKANFAKLDNQTVYSIQKNNDLDYNMIALIDRIDSDTASSDGPPLGAIVSKNCITRNFKIKKPPPIQKQNIKQKPSFFTKAEPKKNEATLSSTNGTENKPAESKVSDNKKQPTNTNKSKSNGGIASFFSSNGNSNGKPIMQKKSPKSSGVVTSENVDVKKSAENTASNFLKESKKNSTSEPKKSAENNANTPLKVSQSGSETKADVKEEKMEVDENIVEVTPNIKANNSSVKRSRKRPTKDSDKKTNKRRKRIIEQHDSDSDDIFGKDDSMNEEERHQSFDEERNNESQLPKTQKQPFGQKNKRKKAVYRTYEDEDGFVVTKTEYVYETASEDEVELMKEAPVSVFPAIKPEPPKPNVAPEPDVPSKSKAAPTKATKRGKKTINTANQPSIMSFFKKK